MAGGLWANRWFVGLEDEGQGIGTEGRFPESTAVISAAHPLAGREREMLTDKGATWSGLFFFWTARYLTQGVSQTDIDERTFVLAQPGGELTSSPFPSLFRFTFFPSREEPSRPPSSREASDPNSDDRFLKGDIEEKKMADEY